MSGYAVSFEDVSSASANLVGTADELGGELRRLSTAMAATLDTEWHGFAAAAFAADWHDWHAAAMQSLAALADLADVLGASGAGYERTEDAVRAAAS